MTLANTYRPTEFSDVCDQEVICKILNKQIESKSYSHAILFSGPAGCGKTTSARIFANKIDGEIFEYDCASHNGVADIKEIIENARVRSLINTYKVFILDEAHTLSSQAWSAMLITLEENLPNSIFIFCTTDTQKIPNTIISRVQRFNFIPISNNSIIDRLKFVCNNENISIEDLALNHIANHANGNLRQALTDLDMCILYGELTDSNVCKVLNIVSDNIMENLSTAYIEKNINDIINIVTSLYEHGYELHLFIKQFLNYCLNNKLDMSLIDCILTIMQDIRYDDSPKNIIIARLIV